MSLSSNDINYINHMNSQHPLKFKVGDLVKILPTGFDGALATVISIQTEWVPMTNAFSDFFHVEIDNNDKRFSMRQFQFRENELELVKNISPNASESGKMREFASGATRNIDTNKLDYEGFLSPTVIEEFGRFMHRHRMQADGKLRESDNWQKGIPLDAYMKSAWRHFHALWKIHRGHKAYDEKGNEVDYKEESMALMFNIQGYVHERLKAEGKS